MELDINQIKEILPHRYPFLLVDRITHLEPGVRATGRKCVSGNEAFFQGHFPQKPVMPGAGVRSHPDPGLGGHRPGHGQGGRPAGRHSRTSLRCGIRPIDALPQI